MHGILQRVSRPRFLFKKISGLLKHLFKNSKHLAMTVVKSVSSLSGVDILYVSNKDGSENIFEMCV